ncbi:MAG: hypothetical protein EA355_11750 [Rhodobacteraceae bacterium]|nr:MAG: hypothetical protein EA355_11750 [Paracoccaceae bacterium]
MPDARTGGDARASDAASRLADDILEALDLERALALDGAFEALGDLAAARDRQVESLLALGLGAARRLGPRLDAIREAAARNMALMQAALDGAAAGRRRVREIATARESLTGYDAAGAPRIHAAPAAGRRA